MLSTIVVHVHDFDWPKLATILASSSAVLYRLASGYVRKKDKQKDDDQQQELINCIRELLAYLKQKDHNDQE